MDMPAKFSPSALILDMDGLLVDSEPLWFQVEGAFAARRGAAWTRELALAATGQGTPHTLRVMHETFGFPVDTARDTRAILDAFIARVGELRLKPGCTELLNAVSGIVPVAVASSSPLRVVEAVLGRFGIGLRIDVVVSGESVPSPKPAPDIFLRAARELRVPPDRIAVLEDSIAGVKAGHAAGMFVVAVPEGPVEGRGFEAVASVVVRDLFEAVAVLGLPPRSSGPTRPS